MEFKFMSGLFGSKPKGSPAIEHATSGSLASSGGSNSSVFDQSRGGWDIEKAVSDGLERCIWILRCVDTISSNMSALVLNGKKGDPITGEDYDLDDDLFRLLNRNPNTYETANLFKYRLSSQVLLSKRGAFIEIEGSRGGKVSALHLLPPHMVEPIPDPKRFIAGYRVKKAGGTGEDELKPEQVIWIRTRPHPLDPYSQITPLAAAGVIADVDFLARLFNRNFLMNDGRPTTLVTVNGDINAQDAEELKHRFSGGPQAAGRTTVIEAEGITVADLSASPRDVQWLEGLTASKNDLLLAFGVPESVLGNASGRTYDNADAEREGFWKDTMTPHCNGIARGLDPLTGDITDDNYVAFDYSTVDVLQRQKKLKEEALRAKWQAGEISLDELLEETGRKKLNLPLSRSRILPGGAVIADEKDYDAIRNTPILGGPQPQPTGAMDQSMGDQSSFGGTGDQPALDQGFSDGSSDPNADVPQLDQALKGRMQDFLRQKRLGGFDPDKVIEGEVGGSTGKGSGVVDPHLRTRPLLEGRLCGVLTSWCNAQKTILVERLGHAKCLKYTRHWVGEKGFGDKAIDPRYVVQTPRWRENLSRDLRDTLRPVITRELARTAREMSNSGFLTLMEKRNMINRRTGPPATRLFGSQDGVNQEEERILDSLMEVAERAAVRQSERIAARVAEMDGAGHDLDSIKAEVAKMVGERSSWQRGLSTYLSTAAVEGATYAAWKTAGPLVEKVWNTTGDEHVRETHRRAEGQIKRVDLKFRVGKSSMAYPGDPTADPSETANCRCWLEFQVARGFEDEYDREAS